MSADLFIDTNILVYAHDVDAGDKHQKAAQLLEGFWERRERPALSVQVLQELHVNLIRKRIEVSTAANTVSRYFVWRIIDNTRPLLSRAFHVQERWRVSFWESLIIAAAQQAGLSTLWSEDLQEGQDFDGVVVVNPLD